MQSLPIIYAYRDDGSVLGVPTRWKPRRVFCTNQPDHSDAPGIRYVVKYRRGEAASAAACISEVVCYFLLRELGIRTLDAALARVSPEMARSYHKTENLGYNVDIGVHFCTLFREDSESGPPPLWEILADPEELIAIWVADCWLMNLDRATEGNTRLVLGAGGRFHLLAADQSDCFLGSVSFADGSCFDRSKDFYSAPFPDKNDFVQRTVLDIGCERLHTTIQAISQVKSRLAGVMQLVPAGWWRQANIAPDAVVGCLTERADRMKTIVDIGRWEELRRVANSENLRLF